jgi:hypothetical protein
MATLGFQYVSNCAGGGHVEIDGSFNAGPPKRFVYTTDELRQPLNALTPDEMAQFSLTLLKIHFAGRTRAEMKTELQAGVTVTV